jgi:hypothetical protein
MTGRVLTSRLARGSLDVAFFAGTLTCSWQCSPRRLPSRHARLWSRASTASPWCLTCGSQQKSSRMFDHRSLMKVKYRRNHQILPLGSEERELQVHDGAGAHRGDVAMHGARISAVSAPSLSTPPPLVQRRHADHVMSWGGPDWASFSASSDCRSGVGVLWSRPPLARSPHLMGTTPACCLWSPLLRHRPKTPRTPASARPAAERRRFQERRRLSSTPHW